MLQKINYKGMSVFYPEISIIIISYNVSKWIRRCLDSLLSQDYANIRIIVVDDGSIDATSAICDEYSKLDSRVAVYHTPNQGVSSARNYGLSKVNTTWFTFVDADDYVHSQYISNLFFPVAKSIDVDLIQSSYIVKDGEDESIQYCIEEIQCTNNMEDILLHIRGFVWAKLFKTSLVRKFDICFNSQMSLAEDLCFVLDYLQYVNRVCFIPKADYIYEKRDGSASKSRHKPESLYRQFHVEFELVNKLSKRTLPCSNSVSFRKKLLAFSLMNYISSIYKDYSLKNRVAIMRNIPVCELDILKYYSGLNIKNGIAFLLMKRYYRLVDILLVSIYNLKRLFELF